MSAMGRQRRLAALASGHSTDLPSNVGFRSGPASRNGNGQRQLWTAADVRPWKL